MQLPHLEIRLVVDGDGDGLIDAAEGERGELWIRGPTIMKVWFITDQYKRRLNLTLT